MTPSMNPSQQISDKHYETQPRLDLRGTYCNQGWLPFPPHSGLHFALPPGSPGKTALAAGRTTCRRHTTSNRDADFTPRSPLPLACLFASCTTNSRTKPSVKWGKGGCGGGFLHIGKEDAGWLGASRAAHVTQLGGSIHPGHATSA